MSVLYIHVVLKLEDLPVKLSEELGSAALGTIVGVTAADG